MLNLDPAQLAALAEVLRHGSFERAASALAVTPSAISQRIKALEERLGTVLVRRGPPATGTEAGMRLFRHAEELALLEAALAADLGPVPQTGALPVIRLAVNADSLATWLPQALAGMQGVLFDVIVDDQDHSAEWLRRGEVAGAVTSRAEPIQGCDCVPLGNLRYLATASPGFVARHFPDGLTVESVVRAPMLTFDRKDDLQLRWLRQRFGRGLAPPSHYLPASQAFVDAALLGLGWGINPEMLVRAHLGGGRLVALDPGQPLDTPLFWQSIRAARPALAPLTRALCDHARAVLRPLKPVSDR